MLADQLEWLAKMAGFAFVHVDDEGKLQSNEVGSAGVGNATSFEDAIARVARVNGGDPGLVALLGAVQTDGRGARDLGQFRVIAVRDGKTRSAVFVPHALEVASDLHRRAAATDLSAAVSHELSNVLGAILGWATLARRGEVAPSVDRALSLIEKSARSAHSTARHLLETARGRTVASNDTVDASGLIAEIAEVLATKAEQSGVTLAVEIEEGLELPGNRADLFTISWNLVQNAIEATPSGGTVTVRLARSRKSIRFEVEDEGSGIPQAIRHRVFEPYFTTKSDGTGLGLSLVRRAADALGGTVQLDDRDGGARFVCRFPTERGSGAKAPIGSRQSGVREKASPRGKRILVVDDDEAMRDLLATALGLAGADVSTAASGAEACEAKGYFDLVLIDLGLGDMRGDAVLAELRARGQAGATALVSGGTLPPNLSSAPDSWLRKPFEIDDLLSAVETLLGRTQKPPGSKAGSG